ncbi:MAG TPA: NAD-dependent epimerase/dehydratase family protein [Thermoplasmata archaeon]|nr:NAD-dependent epimerase/dehydratase family protein [Thermoplasmata archaeon]
MRYFVTGATGFIGGHVARQLAEAGHDVVALARSRAKAGGLEAAGLVVATGDVTDQASMRVPMEGADGVFHLAAWYKVGVRDKSPAWSINVDGTRNVLELASELGVPKTVYTSTLAVFSDTRGQIVDESYRHDGPFLSEYERTKWTAHYEVAQPMIRKGLPIVVVQPGVTYGPGDEGPMYDLLARYLTGTLPLVPRGTAYCWGHVEDTARGHVLAMERGRPGESYILAGPPHSLEDALLLAERLTGIPLPRRRASPAMMRFLSRLMGLVGRVKDLPEAYDPEGLRVLAGATYLGTSAKAEHELGFRARSLEDGLPEALRDAMDRLGVRPAARDE